MKYLPLKNYISTSITQSGLFCLMMVASLHLSAQTWTLWASGLPSGVFPKMWVAPNHDIFYGLSGTAGTKGIIYKANTLSQTGTFSAMPTISVPSSITNNIQTIIANKNSEPIVGIFRSNAADPFLFRFDNASSTWVNASVNALPSLGAFCNAISPNGTIWVGTKWGYIYKSTDNGVSFTRIDETPIVQAAYPCYYPSWSGNPSDGAIYSINVDKNGRVYAGTEGAGIIYSDDEGVSWIPADFHACKTSNTAQKDSTSSMKPLSDTGNLGAIGFTANNNVIFNGTDMWDFNWNSCLGFADMTNHTVTQSVGFTQYFVATGLQITKIVTTANGQIFLHSGYNNAFDSLPHLDPGIYTSSNGINWSLFNTGITSTLANKGQAQGSLAVDGNKVFTATTDGKIWVYDASNTSAIDAQHFMQPLNIYPSPSQESIFLEVEKNLSLQVFDCMGKKITTWKLTQGKNKLEINNYPVGIYFVRDVENEFLGKFVVEQ